MLGFFIRLSNLATFKLKLRCLSCLLTYLCSPVCNWAILGFARLRRANVIIKKSCVIENEFHHGRS